MLKIVKENMLVISKNVENLNRKIENTNTAKWKSRHKI